jgi:arylsulfate sulfotransferase
MSKGTPGLVWILIAVSLAACGSSVTPSISPSSFALSPGQTVKFRATLPGSNAPIWSVNGVAGGNLSVGTVDASGNYTAPSLAQSIAVTVTATSSSDSSSAVSAQVYVVAPGIVTPTKNPQVALYTIAPPVGANVTIQFGPTTSYGLSTWTQQAPTGGGSVGTFVAGMLANTTYHMQASLEFSNGVTFSDIDQTFTTGALPAAADLPTITTTMTGAMTPQSGVELLDLIGTTNMNLITVAVTDLSGNILWTYQPGSSVPTGQGEIANPIKLLPNGHFLINFSAAGGVDGADSVLQEVDLGGNIIWQMSWQDLNQALAAASCSGCNITVQGTHHDFAMLPNGHLIVIASEIQNVPVNGSPNPVAVTGDVLIDLDQNHKPVWLWSTFDHLDVNRQPMGFPDWTHSNAILYSPDDKALILSMRHQDWVIKIDYNDGQGTGDILWKLGYQGDFTLLGGTDPVDWFYAQHGISFVGTNTSGTFPMLLFDNGNNRVLDSSGTLCGPTTTPCASRVPLLQLDETAKTATIEWVDDLAPVYSFFGGNAESLENGNVEFDECASTTPSNNAAIFEVTETTIPEIVWQMQIGGEYAYRGFRISSLYPGVQW